MKPISIILIAMLLAMPCMAMSGNESIYLKGIHDGFNLGYMAAHAAGNSTATEMYNAEVVGYNAYLNRTLNASEYANESLILLPMPIDIYIPPVLRGDNKNVWN